MFEKLLNHVGHKILIVKYGDENISIECEDCNEVLIDFNKEDEIYYEENPVYRGNRYED